MKRRRSSVLFSCFSLLCGTVLAIDVQTYIPKNASQYLPLLKQEQALHFLDHPYPAYFGALIEHESCLSLTHSRCWNPQSRFKTAREEGGGLGMLTRAYTASGGLRFDSLASMRRAHADELKDLKWSVLYTRPDLQIRAVILMTRDNYKALYAVKDPYQRLAMADAAYNGGLGGLNKERRACGLKAGCDPQKWFNNVEKTCMKGKTALYGKRSACDINRNHVRDVLTVRSKKYEPHFR
jgi:hypothetical protein